MARWNARYGTLRLEDANGLGMTFGPGAGDFTCDGLTAENIEAIRVMDRGVFDGHVLTEDLEQTGGYTLEMADEVLTHASSARVADFLRRAGSFAAAVSTGPNPEVWTFKVIWTLTKGATTTTLTLPVCRGQMSVAEATDKNTLAFTYTNNGAPVFA